MLTPVVGEDAALVWFGVMLCVNLQTSFMHPPFGFALFYLRGVAPKEVKSSDIYWGALPFVALQLVLVALVIAFPKQVTMFLDEPVKLDLDKVKIELEGDRNPEPVVPTPGGGATKAEEASNNDLMKALGGQSDSKSAEPATDSAADDIMKALGGKPDTPAKTESKAAGKPDSKEQKGKDAGKPAAKGKTREELAAEEIEKALRGGK
jgi:hypothetical protein